MVFKKTIQDSKKLRYTKKNVRKQKFLIKKDLQLVVNIFSLGVVSFKKPLSKQNYAEYEKNVGDKFSKL